jgi:hypothetical protein
VGADGLGDLRADALERVERRHRILEDHRDLAAAHVAQLALIGGGQVAPVEEHVPRDARARPPRQAHQRQRQRALARTRLADDAERATGWDVERHAGNRAHGPVGRVEADVQVADGEHQ